MSKLGKFVTDRTSGVSGYITTETLYISGFIQYGIQPQSSDGTMFPDSYSVDGHLITIGDKEPLPVEPQEPCSIQCGDIVKTRIPNDSRKLIVTAITAHINGCTTVGCRYLNDKGESAVEAMDHKMFIRYEEPPVYISPNKENSQGIRNGAAPVRRKPLTSSRRVMKGF